MAAGKLALLGASLAVAGCSLFARTDDLDTKTPDASTSGSDAGTGDAPAAQGKSPNVDGCNVFPPDDDWNRDISNDPVDPASDAYIGKMNPSTTLHADFGSDKTTGYPFAIVPMSQPDVPISFMDTVHDDPGPWPIPANAPFDEGHYVTILQQGACKLFELVQANKDASGAGWTALAGATYDLGSNALHPDCWSTNSNNGGLPLFPGLVKYEETMAGEIRHALHFTVAATQAAFVHPATNFASTNTDSQLPPIGLRVRLTAGFATSGFTGAASVILAALKKHGMFVSQGTDWYIAGERNPMWNDSELSQLKSVPGTAFEVVQLGAIVHAADCH
jgi:hypothetical protein